MKDLYEEMFGKKNRWDAETIEDFDFDDEPIDDEEDFPGDLFEELDLDDLEAQEDQED